jgi:hypothetical protein
MTHSRTGAEISYARRVPDVTFTKNLQRHVKCPSQRVSGRTVREVLNAVFADNPRARSYVLDDQGALRKHMAIFIDGRQIRDRAGLGDPVGEDADIYIMQALSGGLR